MTKVNLVRKRGKPRAEPGTVKIVKNGIARLSSDLVKVGEEFIPAVKGSVIILFRCSRMETVNNSGMKLRAWNSRGSVSSFISLRSILGTAGVDLKLARGMYKAKTTDNGVEFDLAKKLKEK